MMEKLCPHNKIEFIWRERFHQVTLMTSFECALHRVNPDLLIWLGVIETLLSPPVNSFKIDDWLVNAEEIADVDFNFRAEEWSIIHAILDNYEKAWHSQFISGSSSGDGAGGITVPQPPPPQENHIEYLLSRKQTQQRTDEWFAEHQNLLTASEIGDLFDSDASLQSLIWSKVLPKQRQAQNQAVPSEHMSPFDWGIRFEPVVKLIYTHLYGANIAELGRMYHPSIKRLAASPDGLITRAYDEFGHLTGNLIEIKCPVSRKPNGRIVPKYYHQMQLQMEVTGTKYCEFAEFIFLSSYKGAWAGTEQEAAWAAAVQGGALHGYIFLVERIERQGENESFSHRYEYGPVNNLSWMPQLDSEKEHIVETIPWALATKTQQRVAWDPAWSVAAFPKIEAFWRAVDERRVAFAEGKIAAPQRGQRIMTGDTANKRSNQAIDKNQQQICIIRPTNV